MLRGTFSKIRRSSAELTLRSGAYRGPKAKRERRPVDGRRAAPATRD